MRIDRQHIDVERQPEIVSDYEIASARRNAERRVVLQLDQHRVLRLRHGREVQADRRLHQFWLAGWVHMDIQYQVVTWIEAPCHTVRLDCRDAARLPKEEVPVRIEGVASDGQVHAREALARSFFQPARRAVAID